MTDKEKWKLLSVVALNIHWLYDQQPVKVLNRLNDQNIVINVSKKNPVEDPDFQCISVQRWVYSLSAHTMLVQCFRLKLKLKALRGSYKLKARPQRTSFSLPETKDDEFLVCLIY